MKRRLSFLFALLTVGTMLASCASDTGTTADTSVGTAAADETTTADETSAFDTVPAEDFGGATFTIISDTQDNRQTDFVAEEENGDTLNDLVYRRNSRIEERYGIDIEVTGLGMADFNDKINTMVPAGENPADLLMPNGNGANSAAYKGHLIDWQTVDEVDLTAPWWDQNSVSGLSVGGHNYMVTGDITSNGLLTSECMLFNKQLFESRSMDEPYDLAFDGKWTWDVFEAMTKDLTQDLNGDGNIDDKSDMYSLTLWQDGGTALYFGMGGTLSHKDENDYPVLDYQSERLVENYTSIYDLIKNNKANFSLTDHAQTWKVFSEGRAYFCCITFQKIGTFFRDMEDDFGIMPIPKYDEAQERYLTNVSPACTFAVIAKTTPDTHYVGTVVEAMAAASYDSITPTLYDVIAGTKNVRDEESPQIMEMIVRNRVFDPACHYYVNGYDFIHELLKKDSPDVVSYMASVDSAAQAKLQSLIDAYEKID